MGVRLPPGVPSKKNFSMPSELLKDIEFGPIPEEILAIREELGKKAICIGDSADHPCNNPPTQMASHERGYALCCDNIRCMQRAATLAKLKTKN